MERQTNDPFGWIGAKIDRTYKVLEVAAEGGFGVVYKAQHPIFGEPVAVKCLRMRSGASQEERRDFIKSFLNEARILYRLSRDADAVVQPLHVGAETSPNGSFTPFLVMEWLHGETLASELRGRSRDRGGPWSMVDAVTTLTPVFDALAMAHAGGIVHRDLKPENLFLRNGHRVRSMKLLDFGIAKVMSHSAASTKAPRAYTLRYAAPEQLDRRVGPTRQWTDVYAMALVLLEMLTGRTAYAGDSMTEIASQALDRTRRPTPRVRGVDLGEHFESFFARALAVDPASRFSSADEMFDALRALTNAPPRSGVAKSSTHRPPYARTVVSDD